ncbi:MAG: hypothetical protein NC131_15945, partial [Roseburia sp.]|nr:hypothetical protein [Roseburia sp.]
NTDGAAGTDPLTYTVLADGETAGTGSCQYGQTVEAPITVANGGNITFTLTVANGDKMSKAIKTTAFVGFGTPKATEATAIWRDDFMTISWSRPTETVDGGYLSPSDPFEYVIRDYDTDQLVGKVTDGTSYSYPLPEPAVRTPYRYKVTGTSNGKSFTSITNIAYAGSESAPYYNDFNSSTSGDGYTVIDANDDGKTWTFDGQAVSCTYNTYMSMDDWFITVPIKLEAGRQYPFSIDARCLNVRYSEKFEVKVGTAPTAEAMTVEVIPETTVDQNSYVTYSGLITAPETGLYYIGVHGISPKDRHTLYVDNLKLESPLPESVPAAVKNLTVTTDPMGEPSATVSFTTPTVDNQDRPITEINRIEVMVGEETVKVFTNPAVGTELSHTFSVEEKGEYTVTVSCYNDNNECSPNSVTAFIGHDVPATPAFLTLKETAPGVISLEWGAVTADIHGNSLEAVPLTYEIYGVNGGEILDAIAQNITGTSIENLDLHVPVGTQSFEQYAVFAHTAIGYSEGRPSVMIPVGYPSVGFAESFASGSLSNPMMITVLQGAPNWMLMIDANGIPCQDNDNGLIRMIGEYSYDSGALFTGKISIDHLTNPTLRFWIYNNYNEENEFPFNENSLIVKVADATTLEYTPVLTTTFGAIGGTVDGWHKVEVDLTPFKEKVICISLETTTESYRYSPFDNFCIYSKVEHNIGITGISAPKRVNTGEDYSVSVTVANEGFAQAEGYTVELYCNGTLADSKQGPAIAAYESATVEFPITMHTLAEDALEYHAVVVHQPDMVDTNNVSESITVNPIKSLLPAVTDLHGVKTNSGVNLQWSVPDYLGGTPATVHEDFEEFTPWIAPADGWTAYDMDRSPVSGFLDFDIPGITPGITNSSFICFDTDIVSAEDAPYFAAHSGKRYMAALNRFDNGMLNDWLVSPLLSGNEQVVSFWAKSYSRIFVDTFEFYYSTGGNAVSDFRQLGTRTVLPNVWTAYNFDLPEGTRYFAVRAVSSNSFLLMLDDVTYQSGTLMNQLTLKGYNVWRNGIKLNTELIDSPEYSDTEATDGNNSYVVTAVYDLGESRASNVCVPQFSGIDAPAVEVQIKAIYNTAGMLLEPGTDLAPGVYMIEYTDGSVRKAIVR